jgi:hypothetical protein
MSEEHDKKGHSIFAKISPYINRADAFLFLSLCSLLILAYVVPSYVHPIPSEMDTYTHIFYTYEMGSVNSLSHFYESCFEKDYLGYDYPFGLWLFGSIVTKITGMGTFELARMLPVILMIILIMTYYSYTRFFCISSKEIAMLSLMFLLSMPTVCMKILGYTPVVFVAFFLMSILYFILNIKMPFWKRFFWINIFIFCLCFTHTGTYVFLLSLTLVFLFIYAALYGDFYRDVYIAISSVMFVYIVTMHLFPYVHPQYIDKGLIFVSVGNFFASDLHVPFAGELAQMFYEQIFVNLNPLYVVIGCLSVYAICRLLIFLRSKIKAKISVQKIKEKFFSIPIIGSIRHVSHSVLSTPFWLGPIHVALAAIGVFKTNRNGLCLLFSVAAVTILPGALYKGYTGVLREIWYFFLIIPILAAVGFYHATAKLETHTKTKSQKVVVGLLLLVIFFSIIVIPIVGKLYYHPLISGASYEITGLRWLSTVGTPEEGCAGYGYRHMISVYADKKASGVTSIAAGSETQCFHDDQYSVFFRMNCEKPATDLYATFGVNYLVMSEKVIHNLGETPEQLKVDYNKQLDKIYSSPKYFSIYRYIPTLTHRVNFTPQVNFADSAMIEDAGGSYLVRTNYYKIRISKDNPNILYIGNKITNFLGEGAFVDSVKIRGSGGEHQGQSNSYILNELTYLPIMIGKNKIRYKTILQNTEKKENWATLTMEYTFFERAMKREIIVANDWIKNSNMQVTVRTYITCPMNYFAFQNQNMPLKSRTVWPCEDWISLTYDAKYNRVYFHDKNDGIYFKHEKTSPYPIDIAYRGLVRYNYSLYRIGGEKDILPSELYYITQYISIGDEEKAKSNVDRYSSVSLYPYPNGEIPIVLTSCVENLNTMPDIDFNYTLNTHDKFKEINITNYTEAVNMQTTEINMRRMNKLLEYGIDIIGYDDISDNLTTQENKIETMIDNANAYYNINLNGFMPKGLEYNLDTIEALAYQDIIFAETIPVRTPIKEYYQEGLRHPQTAYYHGNKTSVVLFPISEPSSSYLRPEYKTDDIISSWKSIIDSTVANDDVCLFLWNSKEIGKPEYIDRVIEVAKYAQSKEMTFTTPYEIAKHFKLLQTISAVVSKDEGKLTITVSNSNNEPASGVAFRVEMPKIGGGYTTKNGKIVRTIESPSTYTYYITTNLAPRETKDVSLEQI